jgi:adenosylmethionine-8-amino-7-oxononanoate aminotransferase
MGNPLACAVANASIDLLLSQNWKENIQRIERALKKNFEPLRNLKGVDDVRVLGAIGVAQMKEVVDVPKVQKLFVDQGVWIRPFGKLIYVMPSYIIQEHEIENLANAIQHVISHAHSSKIY